MRRDDLPQLLEMMRELARFERTQFEMTEEELLKRGFSDTPEFGAFVAEEVASGGPRLVGYAAHYLILFKNDLRPTLMLKGLYVNPDHRRAGVGLQLMAAIARLALELDCDRVHWFVLTDNDVGAAFYSSLGGAPDAEWTRWGLHQPAMERLAMMG